jgi:hypothetical protein
VGGYTLDVGFLEYSFIRYTQRRLRHTVRRDRIGDSVMLELQQLSYFFEAQDLIHLCFPGVVAIAVTTRCRHDYMQRSANKKPAQ